jgi:hypothetical protein
VRGIVSGGGGLIDGGGDDGASIRESVAGGGDGGVGVGVKPTQSITIAEEIALPVSQANTDIITATTVAGETTHPASSRGGGGGGEVGRRSEVISVPKARAKRENNDADVVSDAKANVDFTRSITSSISDRVCCVRA